MLDLVEYRLRLSRALSPGEATHLRGYFGGAFADEVLLHHHESDGSLRYDYPRVQFKVLEREALLVGVGDGASLVQRLWAEVDEARIRQEPLAVLESSLSRRRETVGEAEGPIRYCFLTPWLALNQDNARRYGQARTDRERRGILERVLVGNCLSLAKAFGQRVEVRLAADASALRETTCRLKGLPMFAFLGAFTVNFRIPARLGIGKSVSRGFGTVEPMEGEPC